MPTARASFCTSVVNDRIYVIGGNTDGGIQLVQKVEEYNPVKDTWVKKANMPIRGGWSSASTVNGKIYVFGGCCPMPIVQAYDPKEDKWEMKANMPTSRGGASTCVVNGFIYVIGGFDQLNALTTVEIYDPVLNSWKKGSDLPTPRGYISAELVDGKIYAIGGNSGFGVLSITEEFDTGLIEQKRIDPKGMLALTWGKVRKSQ